MNDIYVRGRGRRPSGILLITFLLGVAVGFSSAYVFLRPKTAEAPQQVIAKPPAETTTPPPSNEAVANTPVQTAQPAARKASASAQAPTSEPTTPVPNAEELWPGRFLFISIEGITLDEATKALLKEVHPAGVVLREANIVDAAQTTALVAAIKRETGFGETLADLPLIAIEQEGGKINPLKVDPATSAAELGKSKDMKGARELGRACAQAAIARGIGVVLAPVLDVAQGDDGDPAMDTRLFGTDQEQVALLGLAFADGVSTGGAIPVAKVYPGMGKIQKTGNEERLIFDYELSRLAELMYPFDEAARQGIAGIMVGHASVPALDEQFPKRPASVSPVLVKKVLRDHWNFANVILADDAASNAMERSRPTERAAVEALIAGCDAVLYLDTRPERVRATVTAIREAIQANALLHDELIKSRDRLEQWQDRLRKTETPKPIEPAKPSTEAPPAPTVSEPPKPEPKPATDEKVTHVVEKGESIEKIARHYGVKAKDLAAWNKLKDENIKVGDTLIIYKGAKSPAPPVTDAVPAEKTVKHLVLKGQSFQKIAKQYNTTVKKLLELNNMDKDTPLLADTEILAPKPKE